MSSLLGCYNSIRIGNISQFGDLISAVNPKPLLLLQGCHSFVADRQKGLPDSVTYLVSLTLGTSEKKEGLWKEITHTSCGGTTSGEWEVGSNQAFLWSYPQLLKRNLSSMLDPVVKCWNSPELASTLKNQDFTQVLPIDAPNQAVIAPSVFTEK